MLCLFLKAGLEIAGGVQRYQHKLDRSGSHDNLRNLCYHWCDLVLEIHNLLLGVQGQKDNDLRTFDTFSSKAQQMSEELAMLQELHAACRAVPAILIPNRIREALIRCSAHYRQDPPHCEDDPTPEALLSQCAQHINLLLENVGHRDADGFESLEEWTEAEMVAQTILTSLKHPQSSNGN